MYIGNVMLLVLIAVDRHLGQAVKGSYAILYR